MLYVALTLESLTEVSSVQVVEVEDRGELFDLPASPPISENGKTVIRLFDRYFGPFKTREKAELAAKLYATQCLTP